MKKVVRFFLTIGSWLFSLGITLAILGGILGVVMFSYYNQDLPDYNQLASYDPPTVTRLYAADGRVLAEYAAEKRLFVPLSAIPKRVQQAFISAEDKNFYEHKGVDFTGVARAIRDNIINYGKDRSLVGGSTITQQVVKNFLLTNEKSIERKAKEAILALKITRTYSKDKILELYLNEIYLGMGSYGVAAAAQNYFNKSLDDLTIEEMALLAAEPKAPGSYDPRKNYDVTKTRRDWVIERMAEGGYITPEEAAEAMVKPIVLKNRDVSEVAHAEFFAEEVRRWLAQMYGQNALYEGGLVVKTTVDPRLQQAADEALRKALIEYDRRHGYRGALAHIEKSENLNDRLKKLTKEHAYHLLPGQRLAAISELTAQKAQMVFEDDTRGTLPLAMVKWTGAKKMQDIVKTGDVVLVGNEQKGNWELQQIPEVNGAMMVLDPHTGRVLALSGGYAYGSSEFNRATQARRQPGSAFKPFVYLAALENGFAPNTVVSDEPVELEQGPGMPLWQPQNYEGEFIGDATMRVGLEKSRNTMTVRITQMMGLEKALEMGKRFGIYDNPPNLFSIVLGSSETTLVRLVNAYGMLANGGKKITPAIIERIDDRHGNTIYRRDSRDCVNCELNSLADDVSLLPPIPPDNREQIADPRVVYQLISMLEGVTIRGTGAKAREIGKIVAGKTGTTNDSFDAWFVGFSPDLVAGVYIGYDKPRTLGDKETGGSVALPAFITFMKDALKDVSNKPFAIPPGIQLQQVDLKSGIPLSTLQYPPEGPVIEEAFIAGAPIFIPGAGVAYVPPDRTNMLDVAPQEPGAQAEEPTPFAIPESPPLAIPQVEQAPTTGTGGLY
jgi:penicillin-binding protein 1A